MSTEAARPRLAAIDLVRGAIMVLMALDHVRDYFHASAVNPRGVDDVALFVTRWITHFCAPVFVFLAGVAAFFYGRRGRTTGELSRFLLTRGLWLVVLENTVVRLGTTFHPMPEILNLQVIWAIGCSLMVLSALVYLPRWAIALFAVLVIAGHDAFDAVRAAQLGGAAPLWMLLHERGPLAPIGGVAVFVSYPLIPWIAVLAAGYAMGPVFAWPAAARRRALRLAGLAAIALFVALRALDLYGDPAPRVAYGDPLHWMLSFVNCEKYPPSLLYLLMTLGPALLVLAAADGWRGRVAGWLITLGRVPMLYYVAHFYVIHAAAVLFAWLSQGHIGWLFEGLPPRHKPAGYGLPLVGVYAVWIGVVAAMTPLCAWFAGVKQRRNDWWLSYL